MIESEKPLKKKDQIMYDQEEEARMKELMNIVPDEEEVAIDDIPLATKPPCIVDWKIIKEGKISQFQIIRADGSSKRPEEGYKRVLWGDLMTMFEPDVESPVWRTLQNEKVLIWKLFHLYVGREKGRIVGIKSFIRLFGITASLIKVSAAQEERTASLMMLVYKLLLLVFRVNAAGTKLQLLTELQLLMDKD
ncbi:hypothetical protein Tco_0138650 [Tanacetum coccineum]